MKKSWLFFMAIFSFHAHAENYSASMDMRVLLSLSDEVSVGVIREINIASQYYKWGDYLLKVDDGYGSERTFAISNPENREIPKPGERRYIFLLDMDDKLQHPPRILFSPVLGIFPADNISLTDVLALKGRLIEESRLYIKENKKCDASITKVLHGLRGRNMQTSLNTLYGLRPIDKDNFLCLVNELNSRDLVKERSFYYPNRRSHGQMHRIFETQGDLIGEFLPILMDYAIMPSNTPLATADRQHLIDAWAIWGREHFD